MRLSPADFAAHLGRPKLARRRMAALLALLAGLVPAACGDDPTPVAPDPTTTTVAAATTTTSDATTTTVAGRVVEIAYRNGEIQAPDRVEVRLGELVTIRAVSDVAEEVHVHTYDVLLPLEPGVPASTTFSADIPGVHEVELETSHRQLFRLQVQ